ncbi:hypothetical protein LZ30DRAFT_720304 [Colletotrichum cereale]|nr:hypothetical protein LZ30DRAFT_720304 [Colletotrichum cereale]
MSKLSFSFSLFPSFSYSSSFWLSVDRYVFLAYLPPPFDPSIFSIHGHVGGGGLLVTAPNPHTLIPVPGPRPLSSSPRPSSLYTHTHTHTGHSRTWRVEFPTSSVPPNLLFFFSSTLIGTSPPREPRPGWPGRWALSGSNGPSGKLQGRDRWPTGGARRGDTGASTAE